MLTEKSVENIMKNKGVFPTRNAVAVLADKKNFFDSEKKREEWINKKYKKAMREAELNIKRLVIISNTYDFVFDNFILGKPASETKRHFQVCEEILNDKSHELREALKISVNAE